MKWLPAGLDKTSFIDSMFYPYSSRRFERPADIPLLVEYFLARLGPELNTQSMDVSAAAMKM